MTIISQPWLDQALASVAFAALTAIFQRRPAQDDASTPKTITARSIAYDRAARAGLSWPLPDEMDEPALERRLFASPGGD